MTALTVPLLAIGTALTVMLFAFGVRRLLGLRLPLLRTLVAGVIAFLVASPIITAIAGSVVTSGSSVLPGLWFVILGVAIALLIGMTILVTAEAFIPSRSMPGPLYLFRGLRGRIRRLQRYLQITRILARQGLLPYVRGGRRAELRTSDGRARVAQSLRLALEDGGVTFIKLGQVLATRRDLLADEFITELAGLQDDVTALPWPAIDPEIRNALGPEAADLFATFDRTPIAAASIAQVYAATLPSGQRVVVKVRRPDAPTTVELDLAILERLAARLQRSTRWGQSIGTVRLADGFSDALREELDFRIEARNMTSVAAAMTARGDTSVRIPVPVMDMSSERILVMERFDGEALAAITAQAPVAERDSLATELLSSILRQIVVDGVFHADPHPGNIFLLTDGSLGLLDFGSVGRIDAEMRDALQRLLLAVDRGDPATLTDIMLEIMSRPETLDEDQLHRSLGRFLARHVAAGLTPDARMFTDLFRIVSDHGLSVPPEIAAVFRSLATVEGTLARLDPGFDLITETRRFAGDTLAHRLEPASLRTTATDELATLIPMLRRLPRRIDRISSSLETGRLSVNVRLLADQSDRRYLTGLLHQVLLAFMAATSGIMSVLLLAVHGGPAVTSRVSLDEFLGYSLLVIAAILALRVLVTVLRPSPA
jgi:ubiquinone biosynthesis protein